MSKKLINRPKKGRTKSRSTSGKEGGGLGDIVKLVGKSAGKTYLGDIGGKVGDIGEKVVPHSQVAAMKDNVVGKIPVRMRRIGWLGDSGDKFLAKIKKCNSEPFKLSIENCDGTVSDETDIYGCIEANDIPAIISIILHKLDFILWPTICKENNFFIKFLINGFDSFHPTFPFTNIPIPDSPLHIVLFFIYCSIIWDFFKDYIKPGICDLLDDADDTSRFIITPIRWMFGCGWFGDLNAADIARAGFEGEWWESSKVLAAMGEDAHGKCDDRFYQTKDEDGKPISFATDYTLWSSENDAGVTLNGPSGEVDQLCKHYSDCPSATKATGIGMGNAPRKYKECCDLTVEYFGSELGERGGITVMGHPLKNRVSDFSSVGIGCDIGGVGNAGSCLADGAARAAGATVNFLTFGYTDFDTGPAEGCPENPLRVDQSYTMAEQKCRNDAIDSYGCSQFRNGGSRAIQAHNALVRFKKEQNTRTGKHLTSMGENMNGGEYTDGCKPNEVKENKTEMNRCYGPFKEPDTGEIIGVVWRKFLNMSIYEKIKLFYKIILFTYILLWLLLKTEENKFLRTFVFILVMAGGIYKISGLCSSHGLTKYCTQK